jgi:pimeloyl-ACP methyl ester carboxylesterase
MIEYTPVGHNRYRCTLTQTGAGRVVVEGEATQGSSEVVGDGALFENAALKNLLRAYALHEYQYRRLRATEARVSHRKQADRHSKHALRLAQLVSQLADEMRQGWCSACLTTSEHRRVSGGGPAPTFLCRNCGAPTVPCSVPQCLDFANRGLRRVRTPLRYCAPHRHDIPSFEKLEQPIALDEYRSWLTFDKANAARVSKIASVAVVGGVVMAPMAFVAAPAIGGATGALTGLSGAAATSHGLAMWGGGALAAGGLGMAGGTAVLSAVGGGLGSALGAAVATAYVRTDDSFAIDRLRDGEGPPVLFATGFLTEESSGWEGWDRLIDTRYPDNPVFRVRWGAKELRALAFFLTGAAGRQTLRASARRTALTASKKAGTKLGPLGPALLASDLARNPWTVARTRAEMTGAVLADLLARADEGPYVLAGHSLGGRVMVSAARLLGTMADGADSRVESVHLLGAAVGRNQDWRDLDAAVRERVWNYHSKNDGVLKRLYSGAELGQQAIGYRGFGTPFRNIIDRDVSRKVGGHREYVGRVTLANPTPRR